MSWNATFQFCLKLLLSWEWCYYITVYRKAFFHPYFCDRYKSLVYLVTLKQTVIQLQLLTSHSFTVCLDAFLWPLSLPWLLFSVRFSLYNLYLEHNFDFFCGWSNFGYFALLRFAFTTFLWNLSWLEKFYLALELAWYNLEAWYELYTCMKGQIWFHITLRGLLW